MRKATFSYCLAIALTIAAPLSQAVVYELQTNGVIREVLLPVGDLSDENQAVVNEWGLSVGATLSGVYLLDGDAPPTVVIDMGFKSVAYDAVLESTIVLPNSSLPSGSTIFDYLVLDSSGPQQIDSVGVRALETVGTAAGEVSLFLGSQLYSTTGDAVDSTELNPFDFLDLSLWDSFDDGQRTGMFLSMTFENGDQIGFQAEYTFNSVRIVPVPGAELLLLGALVGLTSLRRR